MRHAVVPSIALAVLTFMLPSASVPFVHTRLFALLIALFAASLAAWGFIALRRRFGGKQCDIGGPNLLAQVVFAWERNADEIVSFQACRKRDFKRSLCTPWSTMHLVFDKNGYSHAY